MNFCKISISIFFSLLVAQGIGNAANLPIRAKSKNDSITNTAYALAKRVLKEKAVHFIFSRIEKESSGDVFEISGSNGKILIKGNTGVSMASGLNWYLKNYCHAQFTTMDQQLTLPDQLPIPTAPEKVITPFNHRYFFNVCTFSYTMAWWNWEDWERQIDWMAMNGVNLPLAITGQEAVWYEVYKELGMSDKNINNFLVGPAFLPWGWMGNIDGLGGPIPKSWIEKHKLLEQQILLRERALGMTPVLQGFTGHVPESIKELFPSAKLHKTGNWSAGFGGTTFLDPSDDLFKRIGNLFIEKQTKMYGTDHYYSADCFNEVDPDTDDPVFLAKMSKSVYQSFADVDPQATWVMQAWFLYYDNKNFWKEPQIKAFMGAVPNDKMIILDLWGEQHPTWKKKSSFYGKPWIWNVLYNFGGRTTMSGKLSDMSGNLKEVINSPQKGNLSGIGMAMEYFGNNPVVEEFVMSMVWKNDVPDVKNWLTSYATNRYGAKNEYAAKAWEGMLQTVYNTHKQNGTFLCERPGFYSPTMAYRTSPIPDYDSEVLGIALENLLKCAAEFKNKESYQFDVVNLTRQYLSPLAYYWILELEDAYKKKELNRFLKVKGQFISLINDFDLLLSTRKEYLLGTWLEDAKKWGESDKEKSLYEKNARSLITLCGDSCTENQFDDLNNYAYKQMAGMFSDYHLVRWTKFFNQLEKALRNNENWDRKPFFEASCEWEKNWAHQRKSFTKIPKGNPVEISRNMWKKYSPFLVSNGKK